MQGASDALGIGVAGSDVVEPQHHHVEDGQAPAGQQDALPAGGSLPSWHRHSSLRGFEDRGKTLRLWPDVLQSEFCGPLAFPKFGAW